ncbi:PREDICTED: carboxy-terminal kinesin 2-like isoform X1 [Priapulus caudatus]|uniref:Carboxy-terminal kinesin 2-like isoform X1 n=1 Tax=Priapulus caudatus TaxID=37621 RepID=A0ABM1EEV1_PRICU|nr:PREDICTED: carboxy-terminal kinesin 2-like isoform X1 [Priapulus caudatus]
MNTENRVLTDATASSQQRSIPRPSRLRPPGSGSRIKPPGSGMRPPGTGIKPPSAGERPPIYGLVKGKPQSAGIKRSVSTSCLAENRSNDSHKRQRVGSPPGTKHGTGRPAPQTRHTSMKATVRATAPTAGKPPSGRLASTAPPANMGPSAPGGKSKRAAWDLKGRLLDMEAVLNANTSRLVVLESTNIQLEGTVKEKEIVSTEISLEAEGLRKKLKKAETELESIQHNYKSLQHKFHTSEEERESAQAQATSLRSSVTQLTAAQAGISVELQATKMGFEQKVSESQKLQAEIAELRKLLAEREATVRAGEQKIREDEAVRRALHNTIQELKGNIRVICRVRPLLPFENSNGEDSEIHHINFPRGDATKLELEKLIDGNPNESTMSTASTRGGGKYQFLFDKVFTPASSQQEVFDEISQLVQSALDGYNVCIFAYGQTGSGKTYTMEGPDHPDDTSVGMIPRAVMQVFRSAKALQDKGWQYDMSASFMEIYNESLRDLLSADGKEQKHDIRLKKADNDVEVSNMIVVNVAGEAEVYKLLKMASRNRVVAATNCNERSSRSHSVFRMRLIGKNSLTDESCNGKLCRTLG